MTTGVICTPPILQFTLNNGQLAAGGSILTQVGGINAATFQDQPLAVPLPNPIPLNSRGEISNAVGATCQLFLTPNTVYTFTLFDGPNGTGNQIWVATYVNGVQLSGSAAAALLNTVLNVAILSSLLQAPAEAAISVTPVNFTYPPGHVYRYGTNTTPGTTDMTAAINAAANVCRQGAYTVQIPGWEKLLVSGSINITNCRVVGLGCAPGFNGGIQASSAVFDVLTSTGGTIIDNLFVDGGWDQVTTGQAGDILSLKAVSPAHPYVNSFSNCTFVNAKQRGIYIERGGYTSLFHMRVLTCGLHALECWGSNTDPTTSIRDYGGSQYGGTPNGYGIKLTNTTAMVFQGTICESTNGVSLNGSTFNNAITFDGIYQEFNPTPSFTAKIDNGSGGAGNILTVTAPATLAGLGVGSVPTGGSGTAVILNQQTGNPGSTGTYTLSGGTQLVGSTAMTAPPIPFIDNAGGSALTIRGSYFATGGFPFGPGIPVFQNWINVYFQGNRFINGTQGPLPLANRVFTNTGGTLILSATGDATAAQISLPPGTWRLYGTVQTIVSSGAGTLTQLACQITSNSSATSPANGLGGGFVEGADQTQSIGSSQDARAKCFTTVQVTVNPTIYYLRVHLSLSGTINEAYQGFLRAELIE